MRSVDPVEIRTIHKGESMRKSCLPLTVILLLLILTLSFLFGPRPFVPEAAAQTVYFESGWEDGQDSGLSDRVEYSQNVAGYYNSASPPPECSRRGRETLRSGNYSLMIAGYSRAPYAYCYYRVFDLNLKIEAGMKIGYWIYHRLGTPKIAVDGHFSSGETMRDFGNGVLKDQYGVRIHPGARQDPMNQWHYVEVDLSPAAGRTLSTLMFAFDSGNDGFQGAYRSYVDDLRIFTPLDPCQASVSADRWKGEYFNNAGLSGYPVMVRDDGNGFLGFDWGTNSPQPSCNLPADNFSARWTRTVYFPEGSYQFQIGSDDGARFYIDGVLILDRWMDRAMTTDPVMVFLPEGNHVLRLEYYEKGGLAAANLSWKAAVDPCRTAVPADRWKAEYFNNLYLSGAPVMIRDDGQGFLDFDWGEGSPNSSCGVAVDNFSARWTRTVYFPAGDYEFKIASDDGVRFYVDGALQLDRWVERAMATDTVKLTLSEGNHALKVEYFEKGGLAALDLSWQVAVDPCRANVPADRWKGEYFDSINPSGAPAMVRDDGVGALAFDWGLGSPSSLCGIGSDNFSVRWTRNVVFENGTYEFTVRADDGVRLWVGGQLIVDRWIDQAPTTYKVSIPLSGQSQVKMEYYERGYGATASLSWRKLVDPGPQPSAASKLTIHGGFTGGESMRFIAQVQPAWVKVLDRVDLAREIKLRSPGTKIVGRIYHPDQPQDGDPLQRAREWWSKVAGIVLNHPDVDYWEGYNEPGVGDLAAMNWYARFEAERVRILARNGAKACIGNFSMGVPDVTNPQMWPAFYVAIDEALANGGILGLHEYSAPSMQNYFDPATGEGWLTGRYRKVYRQFLIPDGRRIPLIITECGIDGGTGWKNFTNAKDYLQQLEWYDNLLKEDDYVLAATIYSLELPDPKWDSFDIAGEVLDTLIDYIR